MRKGLPETGQPFDRSLQLAVVYGSRERDNVTDVSHAGKIHDTALKSKAEACVPGRAVFTEIKIEFVVFRIQPQFIHAGEELVIIILSFASPDDLADAGNQAVHSGHCFTVIILFHVESLDLFRIVGDKHRFFENLLSQITLVLCLQVAAPEYLIIKLVIVFFQKFNGLGIGYMAELGMQYAIQTIQQILIYKLIEEIHLFRSMFQHIADNIF